MQFKKCRTATAFKKHSCAGGDGIMLPHRHCDCMVGRRGKDCLPPSCSLFRYLQWLPRQQQLPPPCSWGRSFSAKGWLCASSRLLLGLHTPQPSLLSQGARKCCLARLPSGSDMAPCSGRFQGAWSLCCQSRATRAWPPGVFCLSSQLCTGLHTC